MNLIILGAPGSGKGTQADLLAEKFHLNHLSSGQLLRKEAESGTPKGKLIADLMVSGGLLPFETVLSILEPALLNANNNFVLDGTPRNLSQAEALDYLLEQKKIKIDRVIYLDIPLEAGITRIMKRAGEQHRSDDNYESVKKRMVTYQEETMPVIDFYQKKGILLKVDGTPNIQTIFNDIVSKLITA